MLALIARSPWIRLVPVVATVVVLQLSLAATVRPFGVTVDLALLVAVAAGLVAGQEKGAIAAFVAGLAVDLVLSTPLGLSALTYSVVAYLVATVQRGLRAGGFPARVTMFVASAGAVGLWAVLATLFGRQDVLTSRLVRITLVVALANALVCRPALATLRWVFASTPEVSRRGS